MDIIPIEVKAGESVSAASFKNYTRERKPKTAIRYSKNGYLENDLITNIPLYLVRKTDDLI